jgi:DtxR family Mn-dependent transcriptional regulator
MSSKRQKRQEASPVSEEYLETIYKLEEKTGFARTSELVDQLKVAPGSITNTVESLEKQGLITHEPYRGVKLTDLGRGIALSVIRRHRLFERLLTDVLHLDWSRAHEAACRLEHGATKEVTERIEETLGHPSSCPHGNPIPTESGGISEEKSQPLDCLEEGERGVVVKILDEGRDVLEYLSHLKLMPGATVEVEEKAQPDGSITVNVAGKSRVLNRALASMIRVKPEVSDEPARPLSELRDGMSGIVVSTGIGWRGGRGRREVKFSGFERRLMDMGLTPGTRVTVVKSAPFRGPVEVLVRGSRLALGRGMAEKILVKAEE